MFKKQISGSIICPACQQIVPIEVEECPHCAYKNPGFWGYAKVIKKLGVDLGFTSLVIWGCIALYIASLLIDLQGITNQGTNGLLSPSSPSLFLLGSTGAYPIFVFGRWWTVFTSAWLHGSLIHITFNLLWIRELAPLVARFYGAGRLIIIYTISAVTCALLTSFAGLYFDSLPNIFHGAKFAIGASGGLFGLFGALFSYGRIAEDFAIKQRYWTYAVVFFVIGFIMPNVDNWGHLGGFIGSYLVCRLPWFSPLKQESKLHLLVGLLCLLTIIFSLALSVVHGILFVNDF